MKRALALGMLAAAFALGTWIGWGMVPLIGILWGVLAASGRRREAAAPERHPSPWRATGLAALAAALAWIAWLGYNGLAGQGGLGRLAGRLAAVMQVPLGLLLVGTIAFPALLAGTAALIGSDLVSSIRTRRRRGFDER